MASEVLCTVLRCSSSYLSPKLTNHRLSYPPQTQRCLHVFKTRCSLTTPTASTGTSLLTENRRTANYQPKTWSQELLQSLSSSDQPVEMYEERARKLEERVRCMINDEGADLWERVQLVDEIERLGLGCRFEKDSKKVLNKICQEFDTRTDKNLHLTAIYFRLLRQHGYDVSQDVFSSFKDKHGRFKPSVYEDVKGILSLYEASYFGYEGESILDEAKEFTRNRLREVMEEEDMDQIVAEEIKHALETPLNRRMKRFEARWSIEAYSKRHDAKPELVQLAIQDFNTTQLVLQRDLGDMSRWWTSLGMSKKLSFARDRLMECFFWSLGIADAEPRYSNYRKALTKVAALLTTLDDIYDVHGTLDELQLFTHVVERWDVNMVENLPDYMKLFFLALYNTVNDMVYEILKEKGEIVLPYLTKAWADLCKAFLQEAKWSYNKSTPRFEEYMENAWLSSSGPLFLLHSYSFVTPQFSKKEIHSLQSYPPVVRCPSTIFRLCNDLATASAEMEIGKTVNALSCYMNEAGVVEESAREAMIKLIEETWKKMNKDRSNDSVFNEQFMETAVNLARISHCHYQYGDGHGRPDNKSKKRIASLIIEQISLNQTTQH